MTIPLEDSFADIIGKAQRGLKISDANLASRSGVSEADLAQAKDGALHPGIIQALAPALGLNGEALVSLGAQAYQPAEVSLCGLEVFNSPFEDMTVNCYLVWDTSCKEAVAFDTGADATAMLDFLAKNGLALKLLLLTHTHADHILQLDGVVKKTGAAVFVGGREPALEGAAAFTAGKQFSAGRLAIETRLTVDLKRHDAVIHLLIHTAPLAEGEILFEYIGSPNAAEIAKAAADLLPSEVNASAVPLIDETPFVRWLTTNFTSEKYGIVRLTVSHSFFLRSIPMRWETMKKSLIKALVNATKG